MEKIELDETFPLYCEICEEISLPEEILLEIMAENGESIEDNWYLHLHDGDLDEDSGLVTNTEIYVFCPEHAPEEPFPTKDENSNFDVEEKIEEMKEKYIQE